VVSALLERAPLAEEELSGDDGWVFVASPRRNAPRSLGELVAERKARLRAVAAEMAAGQQREGDISQMTQEHSEFEGLRQRANGQIID